MRAELFLVVLVAAWGGSASPEEWASGFADWSPDRRHVVYARTVEGRYQLFVVDLTTNVHQRLHESTGDDISPAWSPDGKHVVFVSDRDENMELYRLDVADGTATRLTQSSGSEMAPDWTAAGLTYAYSPETDPSKLGGSSRLYLSAADGTNARELLTDGIQHYPRWSPDGTRLVFSGVVPAYGRGYGVFVRTQSGEVRRVSGEQTAFNAAWVGGNSTVVFISPVDGTATVHIANVQADTPQQLSNNDVPWFEPRPSPDGQHILVRVGAGVAHQGIALLDRSCSFIRYLVQRP